MKAIIDRFEDNNLAVLELNDQPGNMLTVSCNELPSNACQGDVLYYQDGMWALAEEETNQSQNDIDELFNSLLVRDDNEEDSYQDNAYSEDE
ncbi:DUF3006 domain-containing protein [Lancefieldella parvula]|uniref:DUF3006 domain-containing protein n=1 Tax=Lancefieldella parvula TaxID=1382 RepID=UPI00288B59DD|nr:DUF3006 domain-containing protein [Lancefieldella parvula]